MTYNRRLQIHIKKLFYQKLGLSYKDIFKKGNKENKTNLFTAYPQYSAMYKSPQAVDGQIYPKLLYCYSPLGKSSRTLYCCNKATTSNTPAVVKS